MTECEKETTHRLYVFIKKKQQQQQQRELGEMRDNSARIWRVLSTYTGMTCELSLKLFYYTFQFQVWCVHCPISAEIGLVRTIYVREFCYSFDYILNVHFRPPSVS